jgi:RNA polymerase-interacting CarD/CdnL/TRCF family regulator
VTHSSNNSDTDKVETEGLTITTAIDKDKLQQAFETTEQALNDQHKTMKPEPKAEFIIMLYTALIDNEKQNFDKKLLNTAIYLVENELSVQRRSMSSIKNFIDYCYLHTVY